MKYTQNIYLKKKTKMLLLYWVLIGFVAGAVAKAITPQKEKGGWISSIIVGIIGSMVGGFLSDMIGIDSSGLLLSLVVSIVGALIVLFIYHKYLADKLDLPL